MKLHHVAVLLAVTFGGEAGAQTKAAEPTFREKVAASTTALRLDGRSLQGPGVVTLAAAVDRARYVLVGEAHFSREIPRFATALCRLMAPGGLRALAVETGPEAAAIVNADLRRSDRRARLAAFMHAHPDAMAFQNGADESDMAAACAEEAGPHFAVWGLDQEFFGAGGFLLDAMAAASSGRVAGAAIERLRVMDRSATAAALASRSPSKFFVYTVTDAQIEEARRAVERDGGPRVRRLFDGLVETRAIFLASASGDGDPNGRRARLIKRTLAAYLAQGPAGSRVLMKFGDGHTGKGVNSLGQRDLGNFVAERAEGESASSLHILVMGAEGALGGYNGVGRQVKVRPYAPLEGADYPWLKEALAAHPVGPDWLLIDLRQLGEQSITDVPASWRRLVQAYDLVVIAPKLTPAVLLGAEDAGGDGTAARRE